MYHRLRIPGNRHVCNRVRKLFYFWRQIVSGVHVASSHVTSVLDSESTSGTGMGTLSMSMSNRWWCNCKCGRRWTQPVA